MPMISAMIVMTTSSSTSVKPRASRSRAANFPTPRLVMYVPSAHNLTDREKRGHHRHDQAADDDRNGDDRRRPDDADDAVEAALELGLVEFSDASGEHRQLTCLFAQA